MNLRIQHNLQVDLDIPNLKAMCTMWLAVQRHRVKVYEMLLKIVSELKSKDTCTTAMMRFFH